jgi:hypothetical protein
MYIRISDISKLIPVGDTQCYFIGCKKEARFIASNEFETGAYCKEHAKEIANECQPEYEADCPNCGCKFGVGL